MLICSLCFVSDPKSTSEALTHSGWRQATVEEMSVLHVNARLELVPLPREKLLKVATRYIVLKWALKD